MSASGAGGLGAAPPHGPIICAPMHLPTAARKRPQMESTRPHTRAAVQQDTAGHGRTGQDRAGGGKPSRPHQLQSQPGRRQVFLASLCPRHQPSQRLLRCARRCACCHHAAGQRGAEEPGVEEAGEGQEALGGALLPAEQKALFGPQSSVPCLLGEAGPGSAGGCIVSVRGRKTKRIPRRSGNHLPLMPPPPHAQAAAPSPADARRGGTQQRALKLLQH